MNAERAFSDIWSPNGDEDRTFVNGSFNKHKISRQTWDDSNDVQSYFKDEDEYFSDDSQDKHNSVTFGDFDAIPEEFRPNGKGTGLFKVQTSPKKEVLNEMSGTKENFGLSFKNQPTEMNGKVKDINRNRFPGSYKNSCDNSNSGRNKSDDQGNQLKPEFFFTSEKSEKREKYDGKFFYDYELQKRSQFDSFAKHEGDFERGKKFGGTEKTHPKYAPGSTLENQNKPTNKRNQPARERNYQKITKKVTIEKYVNWNDDLCKFEIPNRKPRFSYKYTSKVTSDEYLPSNSNSGVTKEERVSHHFKKTQHFYSGDDNLDSKSKTGPVKHPSNTYKPNRMQSWKFTGENRGKFSNTGKHFKANNSLFQNVNPTIPVIRHEVKVLHVNAPPPFRKRYPETRNNNNGLERKNCQHSKPNRTPHKHSKNNDTTSNRNNSESTEIVNISNNVAMNKKSEDEEYHRKEVIASYEVNEKMKCLSLKQKNQNFYLSTPQTDYSKSVVTMSDDNFKGDENLLINYGREMSDIIVGSYVALNTLLAIYDKWLQHRQRTMALFEGLEKNLSQSFNKNKKIKDIAVMINSSTNVLHFVPDKRVALAGKVVAALSEIVSGLFSSSPKMKNIDLKDFELRVCLQEDIDATSEIYMHCMQCNHQFEEACKLIEEFHCSIQNGSLKKYAETLEVGFLKEMSQLNPKTPEVYYKRLERCYEKLFKNQVTNIDEEFCRAFKDWPDAITVISCLCNRFNTESWDSKAVETAWEEIYELFLNENSLITDVLKKVQDCVLVLIKERSVMEKYAADLQKRL
ncbi:uncharacterized protein NPIL_453401 [Nephila pilipes]|uniref:Uncharacterized protein n=1 Tax=Nephila pilipes TaxID=299642 RepID=A0A8X6IZS9_NEPPI|nr:uncharacterized protein NPIL_453401 [Nephila pilipes]